MAHCAASADFPMYAPSAEENKLGFLGEFLIRFLESVETDCVKNKSHLIRL